MSGASNTLAREFLTDVHQLCSAVAQRAESREEDEEESHMVALGEYLVRGRGFLLLSTLDSIIDQVRLYRPKRSIQGPWKRKQNLYLTVLELPSSPAFEVEQASCSLTIWDQRVRE